MEIEVKVPVTNLHEIKDKIMKLGGKLTLKDQQIDIYLQHPCRDFEKTDEALRIRKTSGKNYLTYKGPRTKSKLKARLEIEVEISNINSIEEILSKLGFKPFIKIVKKREIWTINNIKINLDEVEGLGRYIEVEITSKNVKEAEKAIFELLEKLGIDKKSIVKKTYFEMIKETKILTQQKIIN